MTFDNSKTIISLRIKLFGATVLFLVYIALVYAARLIKFPLLGLDDTIWTLILTILYLFVAFLPMILNYQFVFYSDEGESIILRYFTAGIVGGKKNSVEVSKKSFAGFRSESKFFGLITSVQLFQYISKGVAKYPQVYISALSREQKRKLLWSLEQLSPKV